MPEGDAHWVLLERLTPEQRARFREVVEQKRIAAAEAAMRPDPEEMLSAIAH